MLACVLNSEKAVLVNIQIVRIFIRLREMSLANKDILQKLKEFEKGLSDHNDKIRLIFEYLKQLEKTSCPLFPYLYLSLLRHPHGQP